MKHLTVRNLPEDVADALDEERRRRGTSLNRTLVDLLRIALGLGPQPYRNGLERLAGTWSESEHQRFEEAVACFEGIDDELWK